MTRRAHIDIRERQNWNEMQRNEQEMTGILLCNLLVLLYQTRHGKVQSFPNWIKFRDAKFWIFGRILAKNAAIVLWRDYDWIERLFGGNREDMCAGSMHFKQNKVAI